MRNNCLDCKFVFIIVHNTRTYIHQAFSSSFSSIMDNVIGLFIIFLLAYWFLWPNSESNQIKKYACHYGVSDDMMSEIYKATGGHIPHELLKWSLRKVLNNARSHEDCVRLTKKWEKNELQKIIKSLELTNKK